MDLHGGHHWIMGEHFRLFTIDLIIYRLNSGIAAFGVYGIEDMFLMTPNFVGKTI